MHDFAIKNRLLNKYFCLLRLTVVACLLTGMFFSGGEGIRLLPFSDAPNSSATEAIGKKKQGYVFSVHGTSGRLNKASAEFQKNLKGGLLVSGYPNLLRQETFQPYFLQSKNRFKNALNFSSSCVLAIPSDRAPPHA